MDIMLRKARRKFVPTTIVVGSKIKECDWMDPGEVMYINSSNSCFVLKIDPWPDTPSEIFYPVFSADTDKEIHEEITLDDLDKAIKIADVLY